MRLRIVRLNQKVGQKIPVRVDGSLRSVLAGLRWLHGTIPPSHLFASVMLLFCGALYRGECKMF